MTKMLTKVAMECALEIEMEEHLGEKKSGQRPSGNSRNGYTQKTLKTDTSEIPLDTPRDRDASFEPKLIKKNSAEVEIWTARCCPTRPISSYKMML